jgi:hypothetical protein
MTSDVDLFGVFIPPSVFVAILALVLLYALRRVLAHLGVYRAFAYQNLFDLALYFILFALLLFAFGGATLTPLFG